jgi:hypothetical protein
MRAHNRKIRFGPWSYLNLLDLHSLETIAEWTGKAAVFVSLGWQVGHTTVLRKKISSHDFGQSLKGFVA